MRQLLYVSDTSVDLAASELAAILATSRRNNALLAITGMLLYLDGAFLQVLEGEERAVRDLYACIRTDKRHWGQRLTFDREAPRAFTGWSMGFKRLAASDPETAGLFGLTSEAVRGRLSPVAGKAVMIMLETFCRVQHGGGLKLAVA
jgi:hypothetical protein